MQQNKNQANSIILNAIVSVVYLKDSRATSTWNVPKYGVFSGPYFPTFGLNSIENYVNHSLNDLRYIYHSLKFFSRKQNSLLSNSSISWSKPYHTSSILSPTQNIFQLNCNDKRVEKKHTCRSFAWGIRKGWSYLPHSSWYSTNKKWVCNMVNQKD